MATARQAKGLVVEIGEPGRMSVPVRLPSILDVFRVGIESEVRQGGPCQAFVEEKVVSFHAHSDAACCVSRDTKQPPAVMSIDEDRSRTVATDKLKRTISRQAR